MPFAAPSKIPPLHLLRQRLHLLVHSLQPRIDLERLAVGLQRVFLVADLLHDHAEAGQRAEVAWLAGQHLGDVGNGVRVLFLQEVDRSAPVPGFGEVGLDLNDGV